MKTESERDALVAAVTNSGLEVDDQITVSPTVDDSDPRVVAALLAPLLDGTDDGELALDDGTVTITGEALGPGGGRRDPVGHRHRNRGRADG